MKEVLSKKKSELDSVVKKLETVITDQDIIIGTIKEEMNTVKRSFEQCLTLKDDLNGNAERLRNNVSTIDARLSTECMMSANLKVLVETVQQKEILKIGVKVDKTDQSVGYVIKEVKTHGEEITKIPDRLHMLNKTTEILSTDIEDKWVLVQRTTVALVITVLSICGGLLYSRKHKIDDIEKKIRYLTENKDKPSLQYESLSIVEQIKRRQPEELENKFCVISFSQETHNKHRRITRPSVEGRLRIKKMDEADFVVTNDKSVLKIPHCKVILVFVDHNQKDVILETPGEDEEDIKLLTVQACRKMGVARNTTDNDTDSKLYTLDLGSNPRNHTPNYNIGNGNQTLDHDSGNRTHKTDQDYGSHTTDQYHSYKSNHTTNHDQSGNGNQTTIHQHSGTGNHTTNHDHSHCGNGNHTTNHDHSHSKW
ncbi:unnamed protein product [Mytilus edulis]|uniref:Uncharacterized protein n=1 Tax=Mytilus edulis TaxID=6550 RepID=A0A8S3QZ12_MYTED|nr:unnamed protein product [Mytilus edulis]